jgi:hypothetical protein
VRLVDEKKPQNYSKLPQPSQNPAQHKVLNAVPAWTGRLHAWLQPGISPVPAHSGPD